MKLKIKTGPSILPIAAVLLGLGFSGVPTAVLAEAVSFKNDVLPILKIRCVECHQPGGDGFESSGLDLRTYRGLMKGTRHGAIVTPRSVLTSNLIAVVEHRTKKKIWMPHERKKLSSCERRLLKFWISQGAQDN